MDTHKHSHTSVDTHKHSHTSVDTHKHNLLCLVASTAIFLQTMNFLKQILPELAQYLLSGKDRLLNTIHSSLLQDRFNSNNHFGTYSYNLRNSKQYIF